MDQKAKNTTGAGFSLPFIVGLAQDVASAGGGAQNTTIVTYPPATSGSFIVSVGVSCTTADTVTAVLTYTDAVNTTAQTVTLFSAVAIGTNGVSGASFPARANTSSAILVKYTNSSQTTTKAWASIVQLN